MDTGIRILFGTVSENRNAAIEKSIPLFSLSVSFREIDYLGETLLALSAACENRDEVEFERYRALLIDALDGVSRLEQLSIVNIS